MSGDLVRELRGADPYELLGLDRTADDAAIVAAHRRLVRQIHPDVARGGDAATTLLNLARDVLRDPTSRLAYDRMLRDRQAVHAREGVSHQSEQVVESRWDDSDIVSGVAASPIPSTGLPQRVNGLDEETFLLLTQPLPEYRNADRWRSYPPPPPPPPSWWSPGAAPAYAPAKPNGLGIAALVLSVCACWPLGLIMGIAVLSQRSRNGKPGYICAWVAVAVGALQFLLTIVLVLVAARHSNAPNAIGEFPDLSMP